MKDIKLDYKAVAYFLVGMVIGCAFDHALGVLL